MIYFIRFEKDGNNNIVPDKLELLIISEGGYILLVSGEHIVNSQYLIAFIQEVLY